MQKSRFIVSGHVQGVGFRYTIMMLAKRIGISGQVWNNSDGTVEIIAHSELASHLTAFEHEIRAGFQDSPWIRVDYVAVSTDNSSIFSDFSIKK